ncbi:MAG TPA: hypothetical protein VHT05_01760 [Candidatus Elarobacter sp.]|jgi:hypothetical protein|nr:hypothetical protein [Candidatus Elarobacter sp.]
MLRAAVMSLVLVLALVALPAAAPAASSFTGSWRGAVRINGQACAIQVVLSPNGSYVQTARCGNIMTQQSGSYRIFPNNEIGFTVTDWSPKQRYVVGSQVGSGHVEPNAKPPGGMFRITVIGPNSMVWRDVDYGGAITMIRS